MFAYYQKTKQQKPCVSGKDRWHGAAVAFAEMQNSLSLLKRVSPQ